MVDIRKDQSDMVPKPDLIHIPLFIEETDIHLSRSNLELNGKNVLKAKSNIKKLVTSFSKIMTKRLYA